MTQRCRLPIMLTRRSIAIAAAFLFLSACGSQPLEGVSTTAPAAESTTSALPNQSPTTTDVKAQPVDTSSTTQAVPDQVLASTDDPGPWYESRTIDTAGVPDFMLQIEDEVCVTYRDSLGIEVFDLSTGQHTRSIPSDDVYARMFRIGDQVWTTSGPDDDSLTGITIYDIDTGTSYPTLWGFRNASFMLQVDDDVWVTATRHDQYGIINMIEIEDLIAETLDTSSLWPMEVSDTLPGPGHVVHVGDQVWIANHGADAISTFDAKSHDPSQTISIPFPRFMLVVGNTVWVSNNGLVSVLDGATGEQIGNVSIEQTGRMVQIGDTVMVLTELGRTISAVDISTYEIVQTITPSSPATDLVRVGNEVWVIQAGTSQITVLSNTHEGQERSG